MALSAVGNSFEPEGPWTGRWETQTDTAPCLLLDSPRDLPTPWGQVCLCPPHQEEGLPSPNPTAAPPTFLSWEPPALPLQAPLSSKGDDGRPQELRALTWCRMTHLLILRTYSVLAFAWCRVTHLLILCPRTVWARIAHYSAPAVGDQAGAAPWLKAGRSPSGLRNLGPSSRSDAIPEAVWSEPRGVHSPSEAFRNRPEESGHGAPAPDGSCDGTGGGQRPVH